MIELIDEPYWTAALLALLFVLLSIFTVGKDTADLIFSKAGANDYVF